MTDDIDLKDKDEEEVEHPVLGGVAVGAAEELEVPHDEFDAFLTEGDGLEDEDGVGIHRAASEDDEEDYPFSGDLE